MSMSRPEHAPLLFQVFEVEYGDVVEEEDGQQYQEVFWTAVWRFWCEETGELFYDHQGKNPVATPILQESYQEGLMLTLIEGDDPKEYFVPYENQPVHLRNRRKLPR